MSDLVLLQPDDCCVNVNQLFKRKRQSNYGNLSLSLSSFEIDSFSPEVFGVSVKIDLKNSKDLWI